MLAHAAGELVAIGAVITQFRVIPVFFVDARRETEGVGIAFHPGVGIGHGQRAGHADIDAQRAPAAAAIVDARPQARVALFRRDAGDGEHVDGAVLADCLAGAAADALRVVVLVEAAIARCRRTVKRIADRHRVAEEVLPCGEGGKEVTDAHYLLAISQSRADRCAATPSTPPRRKYSRSRSSVPARPWRACRRVRAHSRDAGSRCRR